MSFTQIAVTGTFKKEDGSAASGRVEFQLTETLQDPATNEFRARVPIVAVLNGSGSISVSLAATNDPGVIPTGARYEVTEKLTTAPKRSYYIEIPYNGGALDLADAPVLITPPVLYPQIGWYLIGLDTLAFATGGTERVRVTPSGLSVQDGTVGAPSYAFTSEPDLGLFRVGSGLIGVANGAAEIMRFAFGAAGYPVDVAAAEADGAATTPARSDHVHAHGSGYLPNAHHNQSHSASDHTGSVLPEAQQLLADGTVGSPIFSFTSDTNTGLYRIGADVLGVSAGGVEVVRYSTVAGVPQMLLPDGIAGTPIFGFTSDTDLGLWRVGANLAGWYGSLAIRGPRPWADVQAYLGSSWVEDTTDSVAGIQAAIDAVAAVGGGVVLFGPYTYRLTATTTASGLTWHLSVVSDDVTLQGMGGRLSVLKTVTASASVMHIIGSGKPAGVANWWTYDPLDSTKTTVYNLTGTYARGVTSLTLATIGEAANFAAGDLILIRTGQTADGAVRQPDSELNEVVSATPGTGVIVLARPTAKPYAQEYFIAGTTGKTSTSPTANLAVFGVAKVTDRYIRNIAVRDLGFDCATSTYALVGGFIDGLDLIDNTANVTGAGFQSMGAVRNFRYIGNVLHSRGTGTWKYHFSPDVASGDGVIAHNTLTGERVVYIHLHEGTYNVQVIYNKILSTSSAANEMAISIVGRAYNALIHGNIIQNAGANAVIYVEADCVGGGSITDNTIEATGTIAAVSVVPTSGWTVTGNRSPLAFTVSGANVVANNSQANHLNLIGTAAAGNPALTAVGVDASINVTLTPKGSGSVLLGNNFANYALITGASTGNNPSIRSFGLDATIDFDVRAKGSGGVALGANQAEYLYLIGAASGSPPIIYALGSDANIYIRLLPKGTGGVLGPVGAVGTPSWTFNGDPDTGMYNVGANDLGFSVAGAKTFEVKDNAGTKQIGFFGIGPANRGAALTQTYATAERTHANDTAVDLVTTAATQTTPWGFASAAQADAIATQFNALRVDLDDLKQFVNSLVDDMQAYGLEQ